MPFPTPSAVSESYECVAALEAWAQSYGNAGFREWTLHRTDRDGVVCRLAWDAGPGTPGGRVSAQGVTPADAIRAAMVLAGRGPL